MCGIAGVLGPNPEFHAGLSAVASALAHRGPDASGTWQRGPVSLAHTRLAVIDPGIRANQPMLDAEQRYSLVYNGEVYNYRELRRDLTARGYRFVTDSDTEVVLTAYACWGSACVERFNGMFALALWDDDAQQLFLARDRLGEKPLYYAQPAEDALIFASEPDALLSHPRVAQRLNPDGVRQFLGLNYTLGATTLARDVQRFPAAHSAVVSLGRPLQPRRYWSLADAFHEKRRDSEPALTEELTALIDDAVRLRLVSDVPLGTFLSGGIDSAAVTAAMRQQRTADATRAFTIGFRSETYNELEPARDTASHLGVDHIHAIHTHTADDLIRCIEHAAKEPLADSSVIPTSTLCGMTRQHVTVALSGDGADELFLGYPTHTATMLHARTSRWLAPFAPVLQWGVDRIPARFDRVSLDYKARQWVGGLTLPAWHAHQHWRGIFGDVQIGELVRPEWQVETRPEHDLWRALHRDVAECSLVDQMSYVDTNTWLVDDILVKLDRASMAVSLEARPPFLDHRLVEFAASIPARMKWSWGGGKRILKRSQAHRLPAAILNRRKAGFNAPVAEWLNGPLNDWVRDQLIAPQFLDVIRPGPVDTMIEEHRAMRRDHGLRLLSLVMLSLWLQRRGTTN